MRTEHHGTRGCHWPVPRHSAVCRRHRSVPGSAAELVRLLQGIRCVVRQPDSVHLCRAGCGCGTMRAFGGAWSVAGVAAAFRVLTRLCRWAVCVWLCLADTPLRHCAKADAARRGHRRNKIGLASRATSVPCPWHAWLVRRVHSVCAEGHASGRDVAAVQGHAAWSSGL